MLYSGTYYQNCTEPSTSGWCATSAYENTQGYYSYKYCTADDWDNGYVCDDCETTVHGTYCVPFYYNGEMQYGCYGDSQSWCATAVDSSNSYTSWDYCGRGNADGDECTFPFLNNNIWYTTCTNQDSSGWCATSTWAIEGTQYSKKYCNEEEKALGITTVSNGAGTTVDGKTCVPMIYNGVRYEKCNNQYTHSWCATSVDNETLAYRSWSYCGYGNYNNDECVFPFKESGEILYECSPLTSSSPWCAKAVYEDTLDYHSYRYCTEEDLAKYPTSDWGTSVDSDGCVYPFSYLGETYLQCTYVGGGGQSWCATSVNSYGNYVTWQYCAETTTTTTTQSSQGTMKTLSHEDCVPMNYGGVYYEV